jgi:pentatricopeptide repeat protein
VVSLNLMIVCLSQNEKIDDAQVLFDRMLERNEVSWNSMVA